MGDVKRDAFDRGYLIAVSNLINSRGESVEADELLQAIGATVPMVNRLELDDYDRLPLNRSLRRLAAYKRKFA